MNLSRTTSLQQVASLKPEVEFEVMKAVLLRENYIQRLQKKLIELKTKNSSIDLSVIGLIDVLRECSIEVVEIIKTWEQTQVEYPLVKPYLWNGQNYLLKITNDLCFLEDCPQVLDWLGFSPRNNPFLIPPDVLVPELQLDPNAYIVFGQRPPPPPPAKVLQKSKVKPIKSPYLTPIVNDADLIPSISAVNKFKANEGGKGKDSVKARTSQSSEGDPFESYIPASIIKRIKECFETICEIIPDFRSISLSSIYGENLNVIHGTLESKTVPQFGEDAFSVEGGLSVIVEGSSTNIVTLNENSSVKSILNDKSIETDKKLPSFGTATIFANNSNAFENTSRGFHESMDQSGDIREVYNKSLRITSVSSAVSEGSSLSLVSSASTKIWTPHEVILQQVVKKKGGELYAITAAGGESRLKAPWRKTRFERWDKEINSMNEQVNMLQMYDEELHTKYCNVKDKVLKMTKPKDVKKANKTIIELEKEISYQKELSVREAHRLKLIKYSYDHFKKVTDGSITNIEKLRQIQKLKDGQALEDDEKLSMSVEDIMAFKIQRQIRLKFGRAIRKALIRKLNRAATVIQAKYKYYRTRLRVLKYFASVRLALALQKLYHSRKGKDAVRMATRSAQELAAIRLLQRLYRGHLGRGAAFRRREFMVSIKDANDCVSLTKIGPGDIEDLTDQIAIFMDDYTIELPISLLSCLRVILYMFNGDEPEEIFIESAGIIERKSIYAKSANWNSFKLILRRKGRFLRRLRQLANYIATPNPSPLPFSPSCAIACRNFLESTNVDDFNIIEQGQNCALTLYEYAKCLSKVFLLQDNYPEYFSPGVPAWLRRCMTIRKRLDRTDNDRRIYESCLSRLSMRKQECLQRGKKYFAVAISQRDIEDKYSRTCATLDEIKEKLRIYMTKYIAEKTKDIVYLEEYRRAKEIGATVAQKDLENYIETSFAPEPKFIRELSIVCDLKKISLLETETKIEISKKDLERDKRTMDFDNIFIFDDMHSACHTLGIVLADLMILREIWKVFLAKIGGSQFTRDLKGSNKRFYDNLKYDVLELMGRRRMLTTAVNDLLVKEINKSLEKYLASRRFINSRTWDWPSDAEKEAEEKENSEIAKKDAEFAISMLKRTNRIFITPAPFMPVFLCLDNRIPKFTLSSLISKLTELNFILCNRKQSDCELTVEVQDIFDRGRHAMMVVDRGMHIVARGAFIGVINALHKSLVPTPRIVVLDATLGFNFENWFNSLQADFHNLTSGSVEESAESSASLGALRSTATLITQCMLYSDNVEASKAGYPFQVPSNIRSNFVEDINSLMNKNYEGNYANLQGTDLILTAVITGILGFWNPPLTIWKDESFEIGSKSFYNEMKDISTLSQYLLLKHPLKGSYARLRMLTPVRNSNKLWGKLLTLGFGEYPARHMLVKWCAYAITYLERVSIRGGTADENHRYYEVYYSHNLRWQEDVTSKDVDELVGDLVKEVLRPCLVYENPSCDIKLYYNREDVMDTDKQAVILESSKSYSRIYFNGNAVYLGIDVDRTNDPSRKKWTYFQTMPMPDMIRMLQPNGTEIYEGRVKKYNIGEKGTHKWYELLANWARLDDVGESFKINALRARDLVTSRVGLVNGYMVRYEIYEERYGQVLILIHGLIPGKAKTFNIGEEHIRKLLIHCDVIEEKGRIESLEALNIAAIFADRLEIAPIKKWKDFLDSGELCPKQLERPLRLRVRIKGGAGRFVGRSLIRLYRRDFIITVYEISSYSEIWALRCIIYDPISCLAVEYRISTLERSALFKLDRPLMQQLTDRFRVVYCDIGVKTRKLLPLGDNFKPEIGVFEVDGTDEFSFNLDEKKKSAIPAFFNEWENSPFLLESDAVENSNLSKYSWALYFDRSQLEEIRGNLTMSVTLSLYEKGFGICVTDNRTLIQAYKLVLYEEVCGILNKTIDVFENFLTKVDDAIVYNVVDDVMTVIDFDTTASGDGDDDNLVTLSLVSSSDVPSVPIASLTLYESGGVEANRRVKTALPRSRVDILVKSAEGLTMRGGVATRNSYVKVKWNKRELGQSNTISRTVDPIWEYHVTCGTRKNQDLRDCTLEIEVFDSDPNLPKADFLGCVILTGMPLVNFLKSDKLAQFSLIRAKNLNDNENTQVGGNINLQGQVDASIPGFGAEIEKKRAMANSSVGRLLSRGNGIYSGMSNLLSRGNNSADGDKKSPAVTPKTATENSTKSTFGNWFGAPKTPKSPKEGTRNRTVSFDQKETKLKTIDTEKLIASLQGEDISPDSSIPSTPVSKPTTPLPVVEESSGKQSSFFGFKSTSKPNTQESPDKASSLKPKKEDGLTIDFLMTEENIEENPDPAADGNRARTTSMSKRNRTASFEESMIVSDTYSVDDDEEEEDQLKFEDPQRIDLFIKSVSRLDYVNPIICIARFNDMLIGKTGTIIEKDSIANFRNFYFEMYVPPHQELAGCSLAIEIWDPKLNICLGAVLYKGSSLASFIEKRQGTFISLPLRPHISLGSTPQTVKDGKATIEICGDYGDAHPWPNHRLILNIFSAKDLFKADTFGLSDPFVRVFFNDSLVGETAVINDNLNPDWGDTERFEIEIPPGQDVTSAILELQVFDKDNFSIGDFLGSVTLSGEEFYQHMNGERIDLKLQPNSKMKESENKNVKGTIQFGMEETYSAEWINTKTPQESRERLKSRASLSANTMDINSDKVTFEFKIVSAKQLIRADTIGSSDPFVRIHFNGTLLAETACINNNLNPVWGDTEIFKVIVAPGQSVMDCKLEFEVFDKDMFSTGDFLGCVSFEGSELVAFIKGDIGEKNMVNDEVAHLSYKLMPSPKHPSLQKKIASASSTLQLKVNSFDQTRVTSISQPGESILNLELISINDIRQSVDKLEDVSVVIRWNGEEIRHFQPISLLKDIIKAKGTKSTSQNLMLSAKPFRLSVPSSYILKDCLLEVYIENKEFCIAYTSVEGNDLVSLFQQKRNVLVDKDGKIEALIDVEKRPFSDIQVIPLEPPYVRGRAVGTKLMLNIFSAEDLFKADTFGLSDPFVRVFFNDSLVGETAVINDNLNPDWGDTERFEIEIPPGQDVTSAILELQVFDKDNFNIGDFLGSVTLSGEEFYQHMNGERIDLKLQPNSKMKESENKNVKGTIQFGGFFTTSIGSIKVRAKMSKSRKKRVKKKLAYERIETALDEETVGWRHLFTPDTPLPKTVNKINSPLTKGTAPSAVENSKSAPRTTDSQGSKQLKAIEKIKLDLPGVRFIDSARGVLADENRSCWRGRTIPKKFLVNAEDEDKLFISRSSRLVKTKVLKELKLFTDVKFLKEYGEKGVENLKELPVVVKEVVSDGPNVATRSYCLEVYSNSGLKLGAADIPDVEDLERVIGYKFSEGFMKGDLAQWDYQAIFKHIVHERLILDLTGGANEELEKAEKDNSGKRLTLFGKKEKESNIGNDMSVLALMRDKAKDKNQKSKTDSKKGHHHHHHHHHHLIDTPDHHHHHHDQKVTTTEGEIVDDESSSSSSSSGEPIQWCRIYTRTHRLAGRLLKTQVLLTAPIRDLYYNTEAFFKSAPSLSLLSNLDLVVKSIDHITKDLISFQMSGDDFVEWAPARLEIDISTKFRRARLGDFIVKFLALRYTAFGGMVLDLINRDAARLNKKGVGDIASLALFGKKDRGYVKEENVNDNEANVIDNEDNNIINEEEENETGTNQE